MAEPQTVAALRAAAEGVLYPSEADAPWEAFAWPDAGGEPTAAGVRRHGRHPASAPVAEESVGGFFAPLIKNEDWHGEEERAGVAKNRALLETVGRVLADPRAFRVGTTRVRVYVVGRAAGGGWAGLKTVAVET